MLVIRICITYVCVVNRCIKKASRILDWVYHLGHVHEASYDPPKRFVTYMMESAGLLLNIYDVGRAF